MKNNMSKIILTLLSCIVTFNVMAQEKIVQTAGRNALGKFAPEFAHYNDDILFGENWNKKASIRKKGTIPSALFLER